MFCVVHQSLESHICDVSFVFLLKKIQRNISQFLKCAECVHFMILFKKNAKSPSKYLADSDVKRGI